MIGSIINKIKKINPPITITIIVFLVFLIIHGYVYLYLNNKLYLNMLSSTNYYYTYCNVPAMQIDESTLKICRKIVKNINKDLFSLRFPEECSEFEPELIIAIKRVESNRNHKAIGDNGKSFGLMQVQYTTAKGLGFDGPKEGLLDPYVNLKYGCMYLSKIVKEKKDLYRGIDAYNRGPVSESRNPYKGNWGDHKYVGKVLEYLKEEKGGN